MNKIYTSQETIILQKEIYEVPYRFLSPFFKDKLKGKKSSNFEVDKLCAVKEFRVLGYEINEEYVEQLKCSVEMQRQLNQKRRVLKEEKELSEIEELFEEDLEIHMIGKIEKFDDSYDELLF